MKSRRIWPVTFLLIGAAISISTVIILTVIFSLSRDGIQRSIDNRNRNILAISKEFIEATIQDQIRDVELLLSSLDLTNTKLVEPRIQGFLDKHELMTSVHVVGPDGRILYSVPEIPSLDGSDITGMEYYKSWKNDGRTFFHGMELTMMSSEPQSTIVSVRNGLVLIVHVSFTPMSRRLEQLMDSSGGSGLVLSMHDSSGTYIIHSDRTKVENRTRNPDSELIRKLYSGGILIVDIESGRNPVRAQFTEILDMDWYLGVYGPGQELRRELVAAVGQLAPWLILVVLGLLLITILATRIVTRPFRDIPEQLSHGRHDGSSFRFQHTGYRETDELIDAMNGLIDRLDKQTQDVVQARDQAEAANDAKNQFLAKMSHELLTPINGLVGVSNLLSEARIGVEARRLLTLQDSTIKELHRLIRDLLDFSQAMEGTLGFENEAFVVAPVLENVLNDYRIAAKDKNLEFISRTMLPPKLEIFSDPRRFTQMLEHLVSNAIKFTEHGRVTISSSMIRNSDSQKTVEIVVQDTGRGMETDSPEYTPLQVPRGEPYTKTAQGIGIGLSLVRSIVSSMGGLLSIHSEPGRGTTITVSVPIVDNPNNSRV